ncbi:MAG: tetratricopeptide repeat/protein kinase domain protein [Chthonomonadaceae bacterium]|nr:tetratricopeptide repeat/protein kinase domain protein [Chthonomonadaceae bacterium]
MAYISTDGLCHRAAVSSARNSGRVARAVRAHFDRGIAWAQIGAYEQALDAWRQALGLAPDLAEAYAAMGSVYMTLGCWQEAVHSYQQAIQAAPDLLECYYGLGSAYGRLGDFDHAIETFEQGCQRIPIERDQSREAIVVYLEDPATNDRPLEPAPFQDRGRPDTESFDFSALLSSPEDRQHVVRQPENVDVDTPPSRFTDDNVQVADAPRAHSADENVWMVDAPPAHIADENVQIADTPRSYFADENVRILEPHPTPRQIPEIPLSSYEIARRKKLALVIGVLVVIASVCLEVFIVTR